MTISLRALMAALVAMAVVLRASAQDAPATPSPATNAAARAEKKAEPQRRPSPNATPRVEGKAEPVLNPEPGVAKQNNVNIRGQAKINSEVIGHLQKSEPVTILEEITIKRPKQDEPARWYRITLPTNSAVWVNTSFLEADGKVKPGRLNMRGGPGENYSILGRLERGMVVKTIETKGDWSKIEPTTNAFGFVAAHLLERTPAPAIAAAPTKVETPVPTPVVTEVPSTTTTVAPAEPVTPATATNPPVATTTPPVPVPTPVVTPTPVEMPETVEKVKKVVSREGILKGSVSIQAPTYFELRNVFTGDTMNYVFSPSTNLMLRQYKGKRVLVTGEELLDERWQNTPVIIVDALQTVE